MHELRRQGAAIAGTQFRLERADACRGETRLPVGHDRQAAHISAKTETGGVQVPMRLAAINSKGIAVGDQMAALTIGPAQQHRHSRPAQHFILAVDRRRAIGSGCFGRLSKRHEQVAPSGIDRSRIGAPALKHLLDEGDIRIRPGRLVAHRESAASDRCPGPPACRAGGRECNLEHRSLIWEHLMAPNQFIRLGAKRGAMRGIGQALQQRRWADLAHRRPVFGVRWTSLRPTCGHPDHSVDLASPANAKKWSNDPI